MTLLTIRRKIPRGLVLLGLVTVMAFVSSPSAGGHDLISGIGLTHLTVYDQRPAPDGKLSGSPHVHAVTDEGYYVISGTGSVELHDLENGFRTVGLEPGRYLQFPPGTVHRLVNTGGLTILVVMGNAGLAERGDARIYFGKAVDENPEEFGRLTGLAKTKGLEGALDRRDASIRAYRGLLELWEKDREAYFAELERFIGAHLEAMSEKKVSLREAVEAGPVSWGRRSTARLDLLPEGREKLTPVLFVPGRDTAFGMCGVLRPVTGLQEVDKRPHP